MELEVQKRPIVKPTSSTIMVRHVLRWEREIRFSCCKYQEPWQRNALFVYLLYFIAKSSHIYEERREEEGRRWSMKTICKISRFGHLLKQSTDPRYDHFPWSTFGLHLVKGPKAFTIHLKKKIRPWKCEHGKCPLTWDNFIVHDVNNPSIVNTIGRNQQTCTSNNHNSNKVGHLLHDFSTK